MRFLRFLGDVILPPAPALKGGEEGRFAIGRADALLDALRAIGEERFFLGGAKRTGALGGRTDLILPQAKRMDWKT